MACTTETREGWPLLTVEIEMIGDIKRTSERGPFLVGSLACRAGIRDFSSALAVLVGPVQNNFLLVHYFKSFVPIAQQAGQAVVLGRLSFSVCLWPVLAVDLSINSVGLEAENYYRLLYNRIKVDVYALGASQLASTIPFSCPKAEFLDEI